MTQSEFVIEVGMRIYSVVTSSTYLVKSVDLVKCRAIVEREHDRTTHQMDTDVLHHSILVGNARVLGLGETSSSPGQGCAHLTTESCLLLNGVGIWCKLCGERLYNREGMA